MPKAAIAVLTEEFVHFDEIGWTADVFVLTLTLRWSARALNAQDYPPPLWAYSTGLMMGNDETWLERWLPLIRERARDRPVLELGCGSGRDAALLAVAGCNVIALDLSLEAIATARARVPVAKFHCQDIRAPFPSGARNLGVVLASLSMHYFEWSETQRLVRRIAETLDPGGILVCRVNAIDDHSYGASGHPEIEPNYFSVDGQTKRFFDESALDQLFADWTILSREHHMIDRYAAPKAVWETIVERR